MFKSRGSKWREMGIQSTRDLVHDWWNRLREAQSAHYRISNIYGFSNYILGVVILACSFVILSRTFGQTVSSAIGWLSVAVAIAGGIQTLWRPAELAEKHRSIASRFSCLRRDLELFESIRAEGRHPDPDGFLKQIKQKWQELVMEAPVLPRWIWMLGGRPDTDLPAEGHEERKG